VGRRSVPDPVAGWRRSEGDLLSGVLAALEATPKRAFPADRVYRHGGARTLELITCDRAFDYSTGHYVDNYIVVAKLASVHIAA
jgi:hypothetical protein